MSTTRGLSSKATNGARTVAHGTGRSIIETAIHWDIVEAAGGHESTIEAAIHWDIEAAGGHERLLCRTSWSNQRSAILST